MDIKLQMNTVNFLCRKKKNKEKMTKTWRIRGMRDEDDGRDIIK